MGGGYFSNAGVFLVDVVFGLYIFIVMLRLLLQMVRADFYNPVCQAIVTLTNPPLRPMRRYIPAVRGIDTSSVLLLVALQLINSALIALLLGVSPVAPGLLVLAFAELASKLVWLYIGAIIIQVIISWVAPGTYNPIVSLIYSLTDPLMRPVRRAIPPVGGLDFSALIVIIALQLVLIVPIAWLRDLGRALF